MKKAIPKVLSAILLALAIAVTQIPVSDVAASAVTSDFQVDKKTLVHYAGATEVVTVPDGIKTIGEEAFANHDEMVKITISGDVEKISNSAFAGCDNLRTVVIGDQVTEIDSAAFSDCPKLEDVTLGASVTKLGNGIFAGCSLLTDLTVSEDNSHLISLDGVLYDDEIKTLYEMMPGASPANFTIPTTVTQIRPYAFWGNPYLENVTLGSAMNEIPEYAFSNCKKLKDVSIPLFVRTIGAKAFEDCVNLGEIAIPDSVSSIHETAFDGCPNVSFTGTEGTYAGDFAANWQPAEAEEAAYQDTTDSTVIPASAIQSGTGTAANDQMSETETAGNKTNPVETETGTTETNMESTEPATQESQPDTSETEASDPAQYDVTGVVEQSLMGQSPIVAGKAVVFIDNNLNKVYQGNENNVSNTGTIDIANDINTEGAVEITSLIGNTEEKGNDFPKYTIVNNQILADQAYYNDQTLTEYTIPDGIKKIGEFAFARTGLSQINIPQGVTKIDYGAFYHCDSLTQVTIPGSVTEIESNAFEKTPWMDAFRNSGNAYLIVGDGVLLAYGGSDSVVNIPSTVKYIGADVFKDHAGITAVNIPDSVISIGESAFEGCQNLKTVNGGNQITQIKDRAFQGCAMEKVILSDTVEQVGVQAYDLASGTNAQITFLGSTLPVLTSENSSERLSNTKDRGYVFGTVNKAFVPNDVTDLSGTVLANGAYGLNGTVYHEDGSTVEEVTTSPLTKGNGATLQVQDLSELFTKDTSTQTEAVSAFIEGSEAPYVLVLSQSDTALNEINQAYASLYGGRYPSGLVAFDMTLYDETGNIPITRLGKQNMTVTLPLPDGMGLENLHVVTTDHNGQLENKKYQIVDVDGVTAVQFMTNHCSSYGIYQYEGGVYGTSTIADGKAVFGALTGNKDDSPNTGDYSLHPKWFLAIGLLLSAIAAFFYKGKKTNHIDGIENETK